MGVELERPGRAVEELVLNILLELNQEREGLCSCTPTTDVVELFGQIVFQPRPARGKLNKSGASRGVDELEQQRARRTAAIKQELRLTVAVGSLFKSRNNNNRRGPPEQDASGALDDEESDELTLPTGSGRSRSFGIRRIRARGSSWEAVASSGCSNGR